MSGKQKTVLAPIRVRANLPAPIDHVFAFIRDPCNDPQWVDTTPNVTRTKGVAGQPESEYAFTQTVGRTVEGTIRITEVAAPHFMEFQVTDPYRDYRITYELRPKGRGTKLTQTSHPTLFIKLGWKKWLVPAMTRRQLRKQMRCLRNQLVRLQREAKP